MSHKKILVSLDRTPQAQHVFDQALEQASLGGSLLLLHCVRADNHLQSGPFLGIGTLADVDTYGAMRREQQVQIQHELEHAEQWLRAYRDKAIAQGISVETDCQVNEPSIGICETAKRWGAHLIVIGRRGHVGLSEIVLGSVSNYVLHHATCSVLVVQGMLPIVGNDSDTARDRIEA
jgi:nucleotide-binding universal stress UspA family protein